MNANEGKTIIKKGKKVKSVYSSQPGKPAGSTKSFRKYGIQSTCAPSSRVCDLSATSTWSSSTVRSCDSESITYLHPATWLLKTPEHFMKRRLKQGKEQPQFTFLPYHFHIFLSTMFAAHLYFCNKSSAKSSKSKTLHAGYKNTHKERCKLTHVLSTKQGTALQNFEEKKFCMHSNQQKNICIIQTNPLNAIPSSQAKISS